MKTEELLAFWLLEEARRQRGNAKRHRAAYKTAYMVAMTTVFADACDAAASLFEKAADQRVAQLALRERRQDAPDYVAYLALCPRCHSVNRRDDGTCGVCPPPMSGTDEAKQAISAIDATDFPTHSPPGPYT